MAFVVTFFAIAIVVAVVAMIVVAMAVAVIIVPMVIAGAGVVPFNASHVVVRFPDRLAVRILILVMPRIPDPPPMLLLPHRLAMVFMPVCHELAVGFLAFFVAFMSIVGVAAIMVMLPALRLMMFVGPVLAVAFHRFVAFVPATVMHHDSPDRIRMNIDRAVH